MSRTVNLGKIVPQKGTDYWTAQDKQEIVNDVLAQIQDSEEVEY